MAQLFAIVVALGLAIVGGTWKVVVESDNLVHVVLPGHLISMILVDQDWSQDFLVHLEEVVAAVLLNLVAVRSLDITLHVVRVLQFFVVTHHWKQWLSQLRV